MMRGSVVGRILAGAVLLSVLTGPAGFPVPAAAGERNTPPLTMEELSVHGKREKPEQLFLPDPAPIYIPSEVRYDLFLEHSTRIVRPWEIVRESGGNWRMP